MITGFDFSSIDATSKVLFHLTVSKSIIELNLNQVDGLHRSEEGIAKSESVSHDNVQVVRADHLRRNLGRSERLSLKSNLHQIKLVH